MAMPDPNIGVWRLFRMLLTDSGCCLLPVDGSVETNAELEKLGALEKSLSRMTEIREVAAARWKVINPPVVETTCSRRKVSPRSADASRTDRFNIYSSSAGEYSTGSINLAKTEGPTTNIDLSKTETPKCRRHCSSCEENRDAALGELSRTDESTNLQVERKQSEFAAKATTFVAMKEASSVYDRSSGCLPEWIPGAEKYPGDDFPMRFADAKKVELVRKYRAIPE